MNEFYLGQIVRVMSLEECQLKFEQVRFYEDVGFSSYYEFNHASIFKKQLNTVGIVTEIMSEWIVVINSSHESVLTRFLIPVDMGECIKELLC